MVEVENSEVVVGLGSSFVRGELSQSLQDGIVGGDCCSGSGGSEKKMVGDGDELGLVGERVRELLGVLECVEKPLVRRSSWVTRTRWLVREDFGSLVEASLAL